MPASDLDERIALAAESLKSAQALHGLESIEVADFLEKYALLLRESGTRTLDAANMEAQARVIRNSATRSPDSQSADPRSAPKQQLHRCISCQKQIDFTDTHCSNCKRQLFVCTVCGAVGKAQQVTKFNIWLAVLLCLFWLLPGIIYMLWANFTNYMGCSNCQSKSIIPIDSPMARVPLVRSKAVAEDAPAAVDDSTLCPFCAEVIKRQAKICKHCHSHLAIADPRKTDLS